ncbi:MAG TPA: DUF2130 domain-containing protein [Patescibacteria group bacterium]
MAQKIRCPQCQTEISIDDVLTHQLEEQIRRDFELQQQAKNNELAQKEADLLKRTEALEAGRQNLKQIVEEKVIQQVAQKIDIEKQLIEKKIRQEASREQAGQIDALKEMLKSKDAKLDQLLKDQVELMKQKQQFEDDKKSFDLDMLKKEDEIKKRVENEVSFQMGEKYQFQIAELMKKLTDAQKANDEMSRKLLQGSQQTQGEVLELELEDQLKKEFPLDDIVPVGKGVNGADIIQKVNDSLGRFCGTIVWESKHTKNWTEGWVSKLKDDMRAQKADLAVIVTTVLPQAVKNFGLYDGLWVSNFPTAIPLAVSLRRQLLEVAQVKANNQDRGKKAEIVYGYLTSNEFKQRIEVWVEYFTARRDEIARERLYFTKKWEKEEKSILKVTENTVGIYGDLQGLIGSALPRIDTLELPSGGDQLSLDNI